jgi:uncharacterized protein
MNNFITILATLFGFARRDAQGVSVASLTRVDATAPSGVGNLTSNLGISGLDSGAGARPLPGIPFSDQEIDDLYEFNGFCGAVVDDLVDDATRKGWKVKVGDKETDLSRQLASEDEQLGLKAEIGDAAKAGRKYGSAYLMMVFEEAPNGLDGAGRPIVDLRRAPKQVHKVVNLVQFDPEECTPWAWDTDARSRNFRMPSHYLITPASEGQSLSGLVVHADRLLYFCGKRLSKRRRAYNNNRDLSIVQQTWAQISNITQADSSIVQHLQESSLSWLKIAGKAQKELGDQALLTDLRTKELAVGKARARTLILDAHEEFGTISTSVAGMGEQHDRLKESLSAVTGEPLTRMFGQAPGGLNADGESQAGSWRERVASYQQDDLGPQLERYYTYQMQALGVAEDVDWKLTFNPLDEPTEAQTAEQRAKVAETDERYISLGVYTAEEVRTQRFGVDGWQLNLSFDDGDEFEQLAQEAEALRADAKTHKIKLRVAS